MLREHIKRDLKPITKRQRHTKVSTKVDNYAVYTTGEGSAISQALAERQMQQQQAELAQLLAMARTSKNAEVTPQLQAQLKRLEQLEEAERKRAEAEAVIEEDEKQEDDRSEKEETRRDKVASE
jgi:crotonobetainyl-CoA:carnitine CoA-transferase CaiB-like acyl-CoA transferase